MNQDQKDKLAAQLEIPKDEQVVLDVGSDHPFMCRCQVCLSWWVLMGPEDPDGETYGPFSKAEIDAEKSKHGGES